MTDLLHDAARFMIWTNHPFKQTAYDHILTCDSMEYTFDIGLDLWLTINRWRALQHDYLQPGQIGQFIDRSAGLHNGKRGKHRITQMVCRPAPTVFSNRKHLWGNCMLGLTYREMPKPVMTLHSRVTYITWMGPLDLALAWVTANRIAQQAGFAVEDIGFQWLLGAMKIHPFKSVPYVIEHGLEDAVCNERKYPSSRFPVVSAIRRQALNLRHEWEEDSPLEDIKFGQYHRMSVRYRQVMGGTPFPSWPVERLPILEDVL